MVRLDIHRVSIQILDCGCTIQNCNLQSACSESHKLAWVRGKHLFQLENKKQMITASEALKLPSAQLSPEIKEKIQTVLTLIDVEIRKHMNFAGCIITINETNINVIQAVVLELKQCQWEVQINPVSEMSPLSRQPSVTGFVFRLFPAESVYLEAQLNATQLALLNHN